MTSRQRPPGRRHCERAVARWPIDGGQTIHVDIGFGDDGRVIEVFFRGGGRVASEVDNVLDDCAKLLSLALQHGCPLAAAAATLGRDESGAPASMVGAAVDAVVRLAAEMEMT